MTPSSSIRVVAKIKISELTFQIIGLCVCACLRVRTHACTHAHAYLIFLIQLFVLRHFGCVQSLTIVSSAAGSIDLHISFQMNLISSLDGCQEFY